MDKKVTKIVLTEEEVIEVRISSSERIKISKDEKEVKISFKRGLDGIKNISIKTDDDGNDVVEFYDPKMDIKRATTYDNKNKVLVETGDKGDKITHRYDDKGREIYYKDFASEHFLQYAEKGFLEYEKSITHFGVEEIWYDENGEEVKTDFHYPDEE